MPLPPSVSSSHNMHHHGFSLVAAETGFEGGNVNNCDMGCRWNPFPLCESRGIGERPGSGFKSHIEPKTVIVKNNARASG
mmetsp:Transcript_34239/g.66289  ORF Transcript_34239/g.66289 Transcript_34239/m.66289 type:complete len:80 (+) Transcript_34239:783-1022(+)